MVRKIETRREGLRGCWLLVPEADRPALGEDEYHVPDDRSVFNQLSGKLWRRGGRHPPVMIY